MSCMERHINGSKSLYIITLYDWKNYGNRLQNYALQWMLTRLGFDVATLAYSNNPVSCKGKTKNCINKFINCRIGYKRDYQKDWELFAIRVKVFDEFNNKHITAKKVRKITDIPPADYYILGSDQVWNAQWYKKKIRKEIFLLTFVKPEQRVCFSPSFGVETLPEKWKQAFKEQLMQFPMLSVREENGAKIIEELTGRKAEVLIDPTLLLDEEEWMKIALKPEKIDCEKKYILAYFLGDIEKVQADMNACAKLIHAEIFRLSDENYPELFVAGPSEFLYLVSKASLILTDSFHACVFSFIFGKPFLVYERNGGGNMISRLDTFLKKFDLWRKYAGSGLENELMECDYSAGYEILMEERKKAIQFLKSSVHID